MNKRVIIGEYNRSGYTIISLHNLREVCTAGNHPKDSTVVLWHDDPMAISLKSIRAFCIQVGKEIAAEKGYQWGGAARLEEDND